MAVFNVVKEGVKKDFVHFSTFNMRKKAFVAISIIILFAVSIFIGRSLAIKKTVQDTATPAQTEVNEVPRVLSTLRLDADKVDLSVGEDTKVSVELSGTGVSASDVMLLFDPTVLEISNIENGRVFDRILVNKIDNGIVSFSASVSPERVDDLKTGTVFTFTVKPLKTASSTTISFDDTGTITALNGENTLGESLDMTFSIVAP